MTLKEQIEQKEKELADLRKQELIELEEAKKKANEERDSDLLAIMNQLKAFNEKHNEHITIAVDRTTKIGKDMWDTFFPWL